MFGGAVSGLGTGSCVSQTSISLSDVPDLHVLKQLEFRASLKDLAEDQKPQEHVNMQFLGP